MSRHIIDYREARAFAQERADDWGCEMGIRRTTDMVAGRVGYSVATVCDADRYTAEIVQPRRRSGRDDTDCCATHRGPDAPAMDADWREANRRYLDRADALAAAGDEMGALLALSAYRRVEAVRRQELMARERADERRRAR